MVRSILLVITFKMKHNRTVFDPTCWLYAIQQFVGLSREYQFINQFAWNRPYRFTSTI